MASSAQGNPVPPQGSTNPPQGDRPLISPEDLKEYLVKLRVDIWRAKQKAVPERDLALALSGLCHDPPGNLRPRNPGCLLPDIKGGYIYVPYDDASANLPADVSRRLHDLHNFTRNPQNKEVLAKVNKLMEDEINEKGHWEFLDGGDASQIDFIGKVKMLAKYRLMEKGNDISPNDPANPQFRFAMTDVTELGHVNMRWNFLDWNCTAETIMANLEAYARSTYRPTDVSNRQIRQLELIEHPTSAHSEALNLATKLSSPEPVENEARWAYFLIHPSEGGQKSMEDRPWTPLHNHDCIKMMKRLAKEQGKWPVVARPWQMRHHNICHKIDRLQKIQVLHAQALENRRRAA